MNRYLRTLVDFVAWKKAGPRGTRLAIVALLLTPASLNATALFQPAQAYRSGGYQASSLAVADVNGDGKPDLLVTNLCFSNNDCHGGVGVLLGNGDGSFQPARSFSTGATFGGVIAVGDVNHDGKPDIVVTGGGTCSPPCLGKISVLLGNGDGWFGTAQIYSSGAYGARDVALGDVNGDGNLDVLVANGWLNPDFSGPGVVGVLLGNGDGTFQAAQIYDSGSSNLMSLAVGDLNGDGKLDVLTAPAGLGVGVVLGNGDGTFQSPQTYDTGAVTGSAIAFADVNGDSKLDVVVSAACSTYQFCNAARVAVLLGNGDGSFQPGQDYDTRVASVATSIEVADVTGDGKPDLLLAQACRGFCDNSPIAVMLGKGDGTFKSGLRYYSGGRNARSIVATDVNGDAKPDLLVANGCFSYADCSTGSIGVLLGQAGVKTTTSLSSNLNPSIYGQAVTLTARVISLGPSTPTGTVRFLNGTTGMGYATLVDGVATLTRTNLPTGIIPISVTYKGDSDSAKSTSAPLGQTVNKASTMTNIKSSLNPSIEGQSVTFTATVISDTAKVEGTVMFKANGVILGAIPLDGQKASITTSALTSGGNWVTAFYLGTPNIVGSKASLTQTVK